MKNQKRINCQMSRRSAVLTIGFVPDSDVNDDGMVTAFTIPEKKAYQMSVSNLAELFEHRYGSEGQQKALYEKVLREVKVLNRTPNGDYGDQPIAPVKGMFPNGFYGTDWNSYVYPVGGFFVYFLGVVECSVERDNLFILRKVEGV